MIASAANPNQTAPRRNLCAVRLIDRNSGQAHHVSGQPMTMFTRDPALALSDVLSREDAARWDIEIISARL